MVANFKLTKSKQFFVFYTIFGTKIATILVPATTRKSRIDCITKQKLVQEINPEFVVFRRNLEPCMTTIYMKTQHNTQKDESSEKMFHRFRTNLSEILSTFQTHKYSSLTRSKQNKTSRESRDVFFETFLENWLNHLKYFRFFLNLKNNLFNTSA
jgi:hypothetical protein